MAGRSIFNTLGSSRNSDRIRSDAPPLLSHLVGRPVLLLGKAIRVRLANIVVTGFLSPRFEKLCVNLDLIRILYLVHGIPLLRANHTGQRALKCAPHLRARLCVQASPSFGGILFMPPRQHYPQLPDLVQSPRWNSVSRPGKSGQCSRRHRCRHS